MNKILPAILLLAIFCLCPSIDAEDSEATKAAEGLLDSMNMEETLAKNIEASIDAQMGQFAQMGMGPEGLKELKAEMLSFMNEVMAYEGLKPDLVKIYAEAFTAEELNELSAFYQTPTGKKTMQLLPQLMVQGMELGQGRVQARSSELEARLRPIFEKHAAKPAE